jgi:DNA-directed RNA polymerase specialized sigma24 family protein
MDQVLLITGISSERVLALSEALERLQEYDWRQSAIVELRFFGGLTDEEVGEALSLSPRTVKRDWAVAKAWLYGQLA